MNDGNSVRTTTYPLKTPIRSAKTSDASIPSQKFHPSSTLSNAK